MTHEFVEINPKNYMAMVLHAFEPFLVVSIMTGPATSNCPLVLEGVVSYRLNVRTKHAPLSLAHPDSCSGGMQFSYIKKRFVYRFNNMVLTFIASECGETKSKGWMAEGELYLTCSESDAFDLVSRLIHMLPDTLNTRVTGSFLGGRTMIDSTSMRAIAGK